MKFCRKCGIQMLDDNAMFCPFCGANQEEKKKSRAPLYIIAIAAVLVLAAGFILIKTSLSGSYKSPPENAKKLFNSRSGDVKDYLSVMPKLYKDTYMDAMMFLSEYNEDAIGLVEGYAGEVLDDFYDKIDNYYGEGAKLTYNITNKEKMDSSELSEIEVFYVSIGELIDKYSLADEDTYSKIAYGMIGKEQCKKIADFARDTMKRLKKVKMTDGYILTLDIKIEGSDREDEEEEVEVCVVKTDGKWCIEPVATYTHYVGDIELKDFIDALPHLDILDQWD